MRRLRGILDAVVLVLAATVAAPWCALFPDSWERLLDQGARHVLFRRTQPVSPDPAEPDEA